MKRHSFSYSDYEPVALFERLSRHPYSLFFDSADTQHKNSRYSYILFHPVETIESKNGIVIVSNREQQLSFEENPFDVVRDRLDDFGREALGLEETSPRLFGRKKQKDKLPPFQGGAAGFFGYDLARDLEDLPVQTPQNQNMPDMAVGIYDHCYAYDHDEKKGWYMCYAENADKAETRFQHFVKLARPAGQETPRTHDNDGQWQAELSRGQYETRIQKVIDYIHAGDIFQANLSQKFEAALPDGFDPFGHYKVLRRVNAAPFAGYMNFGALTLSSASPERFLYVQDRKVETRPIKGTITRQDDDAVDQFYRNQLENSEKDRAENAMIVDLLRNDLSKVCEDHSIEVPQLCKLESFAKLHHLVSTVIGKLKADKTPLDLLQACFPGGSITGAPKVRAMEIIEELENTRRGPYCGSMGFIGFDGVMDTNITIRTLVYEDGKVSFNVGGGIVADSEPASEYDETMVKAEAIFSSFEVYEEEQLTNREKAA